MQFIYNNNKNNYIDKNLNDSIHLIEYKKKQKQPQKEYKISS